MKASFILIATIATIGVTVSCSNMLGGGEEVFYASKALFISPSYQQELQAQSVLVRTENKNNEDSDVVVEFEGIKDGYKYINTLTQSIESLVLIVNNCQGELRCKVAGYLSSEEQTFLLNDINLSGTVEKGASLCIGFSIFEKDYNCSICQIRMKCIC